MKLIAVLLTLLLLAGCDPAPRAKVDVYHPDTATVVMRSGVVVRVPMTGTNLDNQTLTLYRGEANVVFRARWDAVEYVTATTRKWSDN